MSREVVFHGIQIHSAAQWIDTGVEHREVVTAGGQERVHGHTVAGKLIDRHAIEFHTAITGKLAAFLSCEVAGRSIEGVLVGVRQMGNYERSGHLVLLLPAAGRKADQTEAGQQHGVGLGLGDGWDG